MTVYILSEVWYYEGSDILEVFATREKAVEYLEPELAKKGKHEHKSYESYEIWDFRTWSFELRPKEVLR